MIITGLLFIIVVFVVLYLPGRFLLRSLQYESAYIETEAVLSLALGISAFLVGTYLLSWVHSASIYNLIILPVVFFEGKRVFVTKEKHVTSTGLSPEVAIIIVGSIFMTYIMWNSGVVQDGSMNFFGVNSVDGIYHISLINSLVSNFPPIHPGISGLPLRGYHFLYDFLLANFVLLYHFNAFDLFFRYFALVTALLYGFSGLALARFLKMEKVTTRIFIYLLYFTQGIQFFLLHYFSQRDVTYDPGIVQPIANIVNPSVIFSTSFLFSLFILLFSIKKTKQLILPVLLLGVLPGIKIYSGILAYGALFFVMLASFIKSKNLLYLYILLIGGSISAIIYIPFNLGAGGLIFAPLLLYRHFIEGSVAFADYQWPLKYQTYLAHNNYPHILLLYILAMALFFIPTLGLRLLVLGTVKNLWRKSFYTEQHMFWISCISIGFFLASVFIQSAGVFNTVQFLWIAYIYLLIPTAYVVTKIVGKNTVLLLLGLGILVLSSLPGIENIIVSYGTQPSRIDKNLLAITKQMQVMISKKDGIIVLNREGGKDLYNTTIISAFSSHEVYFEPEVADFVGTDSILAQRRKVIDTLVTMLEACKNKDIVDTVVKQMMQQTNTKWLVTMKYFPCLDTTTLQKRAQKGTYSLYHL